MSKAAVVLILLFAITPSVWAQIAEFTDTHVNPEPGTLAKEASGEYDFDADKLFVRASGFDSGEKIIIFAFISRSGYSDISEPVHEEWVPSGTVNYGTDLTMDLGGYEGDFELFFKIRYYGSGTAWLDESGHFSYTIESTAPPQLSRDPLELDFGETKTSLTFEVWNSGGGTLSFTISKLSGHSCDAVSVSPQSETSEGGEHKTITVTVDRSGMSPGTYTCLLECNPGGKPVDMNYIVPDSDPDPDPDPEPEPEPEPSPRSRPRPEPNVPTEPEAVAAGEPCTSLTTPQAFVASRSDADDSVIVSWAMASVSSDGIEIQRRIVGSPVETYDIITVVSDSGSWIDSYPASQPSVAFVYRARRICCTGEEDRYSDFSRESIAWSNVASADTNRLGSLRAALLPASEAPDGTLLEAAWWGWQRADNRLTISLFDAEGAPIEVSSLTCVLETGAETHTWALGHPTSPIQSLDSAGRYRFSTLHSVTQSGWTVPVGVVNATLIITWPDTGTQERIQASWFAIDPNSQRPPVIEGISYDESMPAVVNIDGQIMYVFRTNDESFGPAVVFLPDGSVPDDATYAQACFAGSVARMFNGSTVYSLDAIATGYQNVLDLFFAGLVFKIGSDACATAAGMAAGTLATGGMSLAISNSALFSFAFSQVTDPQIQAMLLSALQVQYAVNALHAILDEVQTIGGGDPLLDKGISYEIALDLFYGQRAALDTASTYSGVLMNLWDATSLDLTDLSSAENANVALHWAQNLLSGVVGSASQGVAEAANNEVAQAVAQQNTELLVQATEVSDHLAMLNAATAIRDAYEAAEKGIGLWQTLTVGRDRIRDVIGYTPQPSAAAQQAEEVLYAPIMQAQSEASLRIKERVSTAIQRDSANQSIAPVHIHSIAAQGANSYLVTWQVPECRGIATSLSGNPAIGYTLKWVPGPADIASCWQEATHSGSVEITSEYPVGDRISLVVEIPGAYGTLSLGVLAHNGYGCVSDGISVYHFQAGESTADVDLSL